MSVCDAHDAAWGESKSLSSGEGYAMAVRFMQNSWIQEKIIDKTLVAYKPFGTPLSRQDCRLQIESRQGTTPWLICEQCADLLKLSSADKEAARKAAQRWWRDKSTPGHMPGQIQQAQECRSGPSAPMGSTRSSEDNEHKAVDIYEVLMAAICCVMCVDGVESPNERRAVHAILTKTKSSWEPAEIDRRMDEFIARTEREGLESLVQQTCISLAEFRRRGKEQVLLTCIDYMASADGTIGESETSICERFKGFLSGQPEPSGYEKPLESQESEPPPGAIGGKLFASHTMKNEATGSARKKERRGLLRTIFSRWREYTGQSTTKSPARQRPEEEPVDQFKRKLWDVSPKSKCEVCGKELRGFSGGLVVARGKDAIEAMLERNRYICPKCGFVSCFDCSADMSVCKVICRRCKVHMECG